MVCEEFKAIFKGKQTCKIGKYKLDGDTLFESKKSINPFDNGWVAVYHFVNRDLSNYNEVALLDPSTGRSQEKVRFYPYDFDTFEEDFTVQNKGLQIELDSLKAQRDSLYLLTATLLQQLDIQNMPSVQKAKFKKDFDYFQSLKPPFNPNQDTKKK